MIHESFRRVKIVIDTLGFYRKRPRQAHSDGCMLAVFFWAVLHNKPVVWACDRRHWPPGMWRGRLPTQSCMSRRLAAGKGAGALSLAIERIARASLPLDDAGIVALLDGKPLQVALHSADADAGVGRGVGHVARGYKLHAVISARGRLLQWRVLPLSIDERTVAHELIAATEGVAYIVADANYHTEKLFVACASRGVQLVAPRKKSHQGKGTRPDLHASRARSIELLEPAENAFGASLLAARTAVERFFAQLSNAPGTLAHLPIWVRSLRRVQQWLNARIALAHLKGSIPGSPWIRAA